MNYWALIACWRQWPLLRLVRFAKHCREPGCDYYDCVSVGAQLEYWRLLQRNAHADQRKDGIIVMRSPGRWQWAAVHASKPITDHSAATIIRMMEVIRDDWYAANRR